MPVTMDDLARICNVSRGTVDRALNNRGMINAQTKQRILDAAKELGYTRNLVASTLATGKSHSIGIIVFDLRNRYFTQMVSAAERFFGMRNLFSYICLSDKDKARERGMIADLVERKVDGLLLLPINDGEAFIHSLKQLSIPTVAITNRLEGLHYVGGDGRIAVEQGMAYLYGQGLRTVHFVCPPLRNLGQENLHTQIDRADGYRAFMATHPDMRGELITTEDYLVRVQALVEGDAGRVGVFCSSDHYALKVYKMARHRGLAVPDRLALMGFDGADEMLDFLEKRLTTIHYPATEIGESAARMLYALIEKKEQPMELLINCPILAGDTV